MRSTQKILIGVALLAVIITVGVIIGLMGGGSTPAPVATAGDTPGQTAPTAPLDNPPPAVASHPQPPSQPARPVIQQHNPGMISPAPAPPVTAATATATNWEDKLNEVLISDADDTNKVRL